MKKTILIAPFDGPLASAVAAAARGAGWSTALAIAPRAAAAGRDAPGNRDAQTPHAGAGEPAAGGDGPRGPATGADTVALPYDPASYVSASALATAARTALGEIDAAIIVADPSSGCVDFAAGKPGELGSFVGARCAGPLYLARELARRFEARKSGRLLLLAPERPRDAALGPVAAMADGAFEGLGRGLFAAAAGAAWSAFGLIDASGEPDRAARYVIELLEDPRTSKAGRWLRFTGKSGIFG